MTAIDTNILVYAHRAETHLHKAAFQELGDISQSGRQWALPIFCVAEFLRVVTHRGAFTPPLKIGEALGFIESLPDSYRLKSTVGIALGPPRVAFENGACG